MVEHMFPAVAVRQWVVVFPKRVRYFLNIDAGCLNRVTGIGTPDVRRATSSSMHQLLRFVGAGAQPIHEL